MYLRACLVICLLQILACAATDVEEEVSDSLRVTTNVPNFYFANDNTLEVFVNATHPNGTLVDGEVTVLVRIQIRKNSDIAQNKTTFKTPAILTGTANMTRGRAAVYFSIRLFSNYFKWDTHYPCYVITKVFVKDRNSAAEGRGFDFSLIHIYRHHIECVSNSTCATFKPNQPQEVVAKITYLNAGPVNSTKKLADLTYTEVLKEISEEDLSYLYINRTDVIPRTSSNITLHFKSHVDEHGFANFNVTLPDLPDYPGYDHFFELAMTYEESQKMYSCTQLNTVEVSN